MNKEHKNSPHPSDIAIIGMACRYPGADSLEAFWANIISQKDSATHFSKGELRKEGISDSVLENKNYIRVKPCLKDIEFFDGAFFGFSQREALYLDPQIRVFLEVAFHALEDAGYPFRFDPKPVGVFAGASTSYEWMKQIVKQIKPNSLSEEFETLILSCKDFLSQIVSYRLDLTGPSYTIYTACSTSLAAVHLARQSLLASECHLAIAGGVTIDLPAHSGYLHEQGMIHSKTGKCRPFDDQADGTLFGDGAGVVVLKKLTEAIKDNDRIYAIIKESACNNDGRRKSGFAAPSIEGQREVIESAYANIALPPDTIELIEAHGTGTKVGDPIEFEGLKLAHKNRKETCSLGSVKANIGHLHAAAGIAGLMKAVLSIKNKLIPGMTNYNTLNSEINNSSAVFRFPKSNEPWKSKPTHPRRAAISSFGVGGTNLHVIVEEFFDAATTCSPSLFSYIFPLSAKTHESLVNLTSRFVEFIRNASESELESIAYTLQVGREQFLYRNAIVADSKSDLLQLDPRLEISRIVHVPHERPVFAISAGNLPYDPIQFNELMNNQELKDFHKQWKLCLGQEDLQLSLHRLDEAFQSKEPESDSLESKLARFIFNLVQVRYLQLIGVVADSIYGKGDGAIIAAICSNPDRLNELFRFYLLKMNTGGIQAGSADLTLIDHFIDRYDIEKLKSGIFENGLILWIGKGPLEQSIRLPHDQPVISLPHASEFKEHKLKYLLIDLWKKGGAIQWPKIYKGKTPKKAFAPCYPFERRRCWLDRQSGEDVSSQRDAEIGINIGELLASIYKEILNVETIRPTDNFFRLGGDSLQLIQVLSRVNSHFNIEIPLDEVYKNPNVEQLKELILQYRSKG